MSRGHPAFTREETSGFFMVPAEWEETPEAFVFKAHLSGIKAVEVETIEDGKWLKISGERMCEEEGGTRGNIPFSKNFKLLDYAKTSGFKISMKDEILTVTLTKLKFNKKSISKVMGFIAKLVPACVLVGNEISENTM